MAHFRYCRNCGVKFEYTRDDQQFDTPACVAAYYRTNPNPEHIHAENLNQHWYECLWCGVQFWVNDYADRGGKRTPKYCSVKHKQAAYRARGQSTQDQAAQRNTGKTQDESRKESASARGQKDTGGFSGTASDWRNKTKGNEHASNSGSGASTPPSGGKNGIPEDQNAPKWKYVGSNSRLSGVVAEACVILGVQYGTSGEALKAAYMKAIKHWHPDRNKSPYAGKWAQAINWAYDFLK